MSRRKWTPQEIELLHKMRADREKVIVIATVLNRSEESIHTFLRDQRRRDRNQKAKSAEAKPTTPQECLVERIKNLFDKVASERGITPLEAQAILLGGRNFTTVPGTETYLKTSAVRRLAA